MQVSEFQASTEGFLYAWSGLFSDSLLNSLTLFGLWGMAPLRVFAKYLKNGLADLHETL